MNKEIKAILCAVLIAALLVICICTADYMNLLHQLRSTERELSDSQENWNKIAEEKEMLQADLKSLQNDLKEAQLSLNEYELLKEEVASLRQQIDDFRLPDE